MADLEQILEYRDGLVQQEKPKMYDVSVVPGDGSAPPENPWNGMTVSRGLWIQLILPLNYEA